jgi:hypothetical protein
VEKPQKRFTNTKKGRIMMLCSSKKHETGEQSAPPSPAPIALMVLTTMTGFLLALALPAFPETTVSLAGKVTQSQISGFAGTPFMLGSSEGGQAVYGIWSVERNDKPCYIGALTKDVNISANISGETKNLCGDNPTSNEMKVQFRGMRFADRTFIRALRICMNKDNTRLKGLQIRGRKIDDYGNVADLPAQYPASQGSSGLSPLVDLNAPNGQRPNCDHWKKWAECPKGEIATAITAHFGPGSNPRSMTGIALQCRMVRKGG